MPKKIALLGSTGSIGVQSLDVIKAQGDQVVALAAGKNIDLLMQQIKEFHPTFVAVENLSAADKMESLLQGIKNPPTLYKGKDAAKFIAVESGADIVLNAIVGIAGLSATVASLEAGCDVALANKESLVTGGEIVMKLVKEKNVRLLPVDSEHSAIFQCLQDPYSAKTLQKILLTASGGPFYGYSKEQLEQVTLQQALKHPNWSMGAKITIDSATLMNKGLEFIEAMWLFDVSPSQIEIVVQRESIIHSMVEFADNSILAQLGVPDMRIPIQYALTYPDRVVGCAQKLDFSKLHSISFGQAEENTFRCLAACKNAAEKGGLAACAANGANEEAVALFLKEEIPFVKIGELVERCVNAQDFTGSYTLEDVYSCDTWARNYVQSNKY